MNEARWYDSPCMALVIYVFTIWFVVILMIVGWFVYRTWWLHAHCGWVLGTRVCQ